MIGSLYSGELNGISTILPPSWDHLFWFDGDNGVTSDVSGVSAVTDRFGGAYALSQVTSGARPALVSWNGHNAFQAANGDWLNMTTLTQTRPFTFFIAGQFPASSSGNYSQVFWGSGSNPSPLVWGGFSGGPTASFYTGSAIGNLTGLTRASYINKPFVFCLEQVFTTTPITWYLWAHGMSKISAVEASSGLSNFSSATPRLFNTSDTTLFWNAPVGTVAATKNTLSTDVREYMMQSLSNYYGIVPL